MSPRASKSSHDEFGVTGIVDKLEFQRNSKLWLYQQRNYRQKNTKGELRGAFSARVVHSQAICGSWAMERMAPVDMLSQDLEGCEMDIAESVTVCQSS